MNLRDLGKVVDTSFGTFWLHSGSPIGKASLQNWLENHLGMQDNESILWIEYSYVVLEGLILDYELKDDSAFRTYFDRRNGDRAHNFKLFQMVFETTSDEYQSIKEMYDATRIAVPEAAKTDEDKSKKKDKSTD